MRALQGARRKNGRRGLRHIAAGLSLAVSASHRLRSFAAWREEIVGRADAAVAISRATAESLHADMRDAGPRPPIGWWPLGADFSRGGRRAERDGGAIATGPGLFPGSRHAGATQGLSGRRRGFRATLGGGSRHTLCDRRPPRLEHPALQAAPAATPRIRPPPAVARRRRRRGFATALRQCARRRELLRR